MAAFFDRDGKPRHPVDVLAHLRRRFRGMRTAAKAAENDGTGVAMDLHYFGLDLDIATKVVERWFRKENE